MADRSDTRGFASRLLRQDEPLSELKYQAYRTRLEAALTAAERRVKAAGWVVVASCVLILTLVYLSAGNLLGDFDPWSEKASVGSVGAAVVYGLATVTFFLSLASYYSRFRPGVRDARERLRDESLLHLQRQIRELRELVERNLHHDEPDSDRPNH